MIDRHMSRHRCRGEPASSRRPLRRGHVLVGRLVIAYAAWTATTALAQQPTVELQIDSRSLELGEIVSLQVVCTNTGVPSAPEAIVPDGLDLKLLNTTPSSSSYTQIIGGRMSQRTTYTYPMQLSALAVGTYTLGPISVRADGTTYQTQPVTVVVRETDDPSVPQGDRFIFAEIEVDPLAVYVSESISAKLTIGIRKVEINGRIFEIDLLRRVLDQGRSKFSVFADGDVRKSELRIPDSNGVRHRYEVFHVTKRVRAEEIGKMTIGPVFLRANYPTRIRRGFFGGYEVADARKETVRVPAVTVKVKMPPESDRPDTYSGAIGSFDMRVSAKPDRVEQGKPVTLAIAISGTPLDGIAGPDLNVQPELASRFDYTKDELVGDIEGGAKVFRRAIFPKQIGEQTIPPIRWAYFDPGQERYVTLVSDPITIVVDPASSRAAGLPVIDAPDRGPETTSLTVLTGGISPNYVDAESVLADQSFKLSAPWTASLVLPPLVWLVVTLQVRHRARLREDAGLARRRRARRAARERIDRAVRNGEPLVQLHALGEALTGYVSDRFDLGYGTLTPAEVRSALTARDVDESLIADIVGFLQMCDESRYAGNARAEQAASRFAVDVSDWIKQLERVGH